MILCNLITLFIVTAISDNNINREIFTNYRGNAQHDGYFKFGTSTFKFPLTSVWNITTNPCYGPDQQPSVIFVNNTFYCITTLVIRDPTVEATLYSINASNGETLWNKTSITTVGLFPASLTYSIYGYISVYDAYLGNLYILEAENGDIKHQLPLPSNSRITSYNGLFYAFNGNPLNYTLSSIDPVQGKIINSITFKFWLTGSSINQPPTFCMNGEIIVLYDVFNLFAAVNATSFELLWTYEMSITEEELKYTIPTICIEPDKILMSDATNVWRIIDAKTGKELTSIALGDYQFLEPPVIHVDKGILISDTQSGSNTLGVTAMNISDVNVSNWNTIWTVAVENMSPSGGKGITNAIIVDDSVILTDEGHSLKVLDINNGKLLWEYEFYHDITYMNIELIPGIDVNGDAVLIAQWGDAPNYQVYALR